MSDNRIRTEHDYINSKRYKYSLNAFLRANERGVPENVIAQLLCMKTEEVEEMYNKIIEKLRPFFQDTVDSEDLE